MDFTDWVKRNSRKLGSEYELLFAERVLPLVEGLRCDQVEAQHHFIDSDGKNRYCDFIIVESDVVRVAIEIDGYDKDGSGTGMSYEGFLDWQRRQASLASQGWHVLRFANRDVRDAPRKCAAHISQLLTRLRHKQTGHVEIVTIQSEHSPISQEVISVPALTENTRPPEPPIKTSRLPLSMIVMGLVTVAVLASLAFWNGSHEVDVVDDKAPRNVQSIPRVSSQPGYTSDEIASLPAAAGDALALDEVRAPIENILANVHARELAYGSLDCKNPLDWSVARQHIGQDVTVIGPLRASKSRPDLNGSPTWLDVGNAFPDHDRLNIVVWGEDLYKFDAQYLDAMYWFNSAFQGRIYALICIKGTVTEYKGVPQIALKDPNQFRIAFPREYR